MTAQVEAIPEAVGDWTLRGLDVDQVFARPELSDDALTAACLTTARFDPAFPGWQLYRRIVAGFTMFDAELDEWAIGVGRLLAQAKRRDGRAYIAKPGGWVDVAARDALAAVVTGVSPVETVRARELGCHRDSYRRIKHPLAGGMEIGMQTFRAELLAKLYFVRRTHLAETDDTISVRESKPWVPVVADDEHRGQLTDGAGNYWNVPHRH